MLADIRDFRTPKNKHDVRAYTGLAKQVTDFNPDLSQSLQLINNLLKNDVTWDWNEEVDKQFEDSKKRLSVGQSLHPFDPDKPTKLLTDASRLYGLGFALMQMVEPARLARSPGNDTDHDTKEKWHLIKCGSASLTDCQRRYATCELEAMAITWACKKCRYYLEGNQLFTIHTDHKPLEAMFKMNLEEVNNTRIHNFREKIAHLRFVVKYTAGRYHMIADALSRAPAPGTFEDEEPPSENFIVRKTMDHYHHIARSDKSLEKIFEAAKNDENYLKMVRDIRRDVDNTEISCWHGEGQVLLAAHEARHHQYGRIM